MNHDTYVLRNDNLVGLNKRVVFLYFLASLGVDSAISPARHEWLRYCSLITANDAVVSS